MTFTPEERRQIFKEKADRAARELVLALTAIEGRRAGTYQIEIPATQDAGGVEWNLRWSFTPAGEPRALDGGGDRHWKGRIGHMTRTLGNGVMRAMRRAVRWIRDLPPFLEVKIQMTMETPRERRGREASERKASGDPGSS